MASSKGNGPLIETWPDAHMHVHIHRELITQDTSTEREKKMVWDLHLFSLRNC